MEGQLSLEAVLAHLSERGQVEWELATTKALLSQEQQRAKDLLAQLEEADRKGNA